MRYGADVVVEALIGFRNSLRRGLRECCNFVAQNLGLAWLVELQFCTVRGGREWNHCNALPTRENGKSLALIWSWVIPCMSKVRHSWRNAWRCRLASSFPVKGKLCTILMIEVLISNGTPMLSRFWIDKSRTSGVHSSPIVRSGSGSANPWWSGASFGLVGGVAWGEDDESSASTFGSTSSGFFDRASRLLCL